MGVGFGGCRRRWKHLLPCRVQKFPQNSTGDQNCFSDASKFTAHEIGQQILNRKVRKERRNQRKARIGRTAACAENLQRVE